MTPDSEKIYSFDIIIHTNSHMNQFVEEMALPEDSEVHMLVYTRCTETEALVIGAKVGKPGRDPGVTIRKSLVAAGIDMDPAQAVEEALESLADEHNAAKGGGYHPRRIDQIPFRIYAELLELCEETHQEFGSREPRLSAAMLEERGIDIRHLLTQVTD